MNDWTPSEFWKNFRLGTELSIAGNFIYNGIFSFDLMPHFYYEEDSFEFLYNTSIGIERLQKVAIILSEHENIVDQEEFEKSLITHNHLELIHRIKQTNELNLGKIHNKFLALLSNFYKSTRYDKFILESVYKPNKGKESLVNFISENMNIEISTDFMGCTSNDQKIKKFIGKVIGKISNELYSIIKAESHKLNIYTYEVPLNSKAFKIFMSQKFDFSEERIIQKEVLKHLLQSNKSKPFENYLNAFPPLEMGDLGTNDYVDYLINFHKKTQVSGEVQYLYEELEEVKSRMEYLDALGNEDYYLDDDDGEEIEE